MEEIAEGVETLPVGKTNSLFVGCCVVGHVRIGTVVSFQLKFSGFYQFHKYLNLSQNGIVVGGLQVAVVANVSVDGHPVVENLGAKGQFHLIGIYLIAGFVIEADIEIGADLG